MNRTELKQEIDQRWPGQVQCPADSSSPCEVTCARTVLPELCGRLFLEWNFSFAGLVVEEGASEWHLRYVFYGESVVGQASSLPASTKEADNAGWKPAPLGWVHVLVTAPLTEKTFPSIVKFVHAADWHEREAEDLFGLFLKAIRASAISFCTTTPGRKASNRCAANSIRKRQWLIANRMKTGGQRESFKNPARS